MAQRSASAGAAARKVPPFYEKNDMKSWIREGFEKTGWELLDKPRFEKTVQQLEAVYDQLPVQLIHRDVHFGNFLFDQGQLSGYIDFDLSQWRNRPYPPS